MFRLEKKFFAEGPPSPPVKGKIFDTRFGLIYVQTGKKNFLQRDTSLVKGKFFDTRFGLIHVQTGNKISHRGTPPGIVRTCYGYAVGGMPLAFTQEDFLVFEMVLKYDLCRFLIAPLLPSGATYLVTMASVCMYIVLWKYFYEGNFFI